MRRKSATSYSEKARGRGLDSPAERGRIAERAARLIIEGGLTDWQFAKRKAARQLGLSESRNLPGQEEIILALREHQSLFQAAEHDALLLGRRKEALLWLELLDRFLPELTGGVAEGWATEHSEIRIELLAESEKEVEFLLLSEGVDYNSVVAPHNGLLCELLAVRDGSAARLSVRRARPRPAPLSLDIVALRALLTATTQAASQPATSRAK